MSNLYARVLDYVRSTPWAIMPEYLSVLQDILAARAAGLRMSEQDLAERISAARAARTANGNPPGAPAASGGGISVIQIRGPIGHRMDEVEDNSFEAGTSTEGTRRRLRRALADPDIGAIVFDVDSPGGAVDDVPELSAEIFAARGQKRIVAVANTMAASAAYWLAAQADELVVSPSAEVGSIGVWSAHQDVSAMLEAQGRKITLVSAGKYKVEGNPFEPLGDDARAYIQSRIDAYYDEFVDAVARGRGAAAAAVRAGYGEGRMVGAREAVAQGMADRVETIDNVIAQLQADLASSGGGTTARARRGARTRWDFAFS